MYSCEPWGGFGASLLTSFLQTTNQRSGRFYAGGYPYSEGIYEDCNKFIQLTYYSSLFEDAEAAVRAYVRYHFCVEGAELDELTDALLLTERALARTQSDTGASCRYLIRNTAETERVRSILTAYSRSLPSQIAADYRFRLFYLRAVVDDEMRRCDGYPLRSKLCQECMREINDIYFADERPDGSVRAPVGC